MTKILKGPQTLLYPKPALLIGADIAGKPSFMTSARTSVASSELP